LSAKQNSYKGEKVPYLRTRFFFIALILGAGYGFASYVASLREELYPQWGLIIAALLSGVAGLFLLRILHHHFFRRYWLLPYLIWAFLAVLTAPFFKYHRPDQVVFLLPLADNATLPRIDSTHHQNLRLELNYETRSCIGLPLNHSISTRVQVPPHGKLIFGIGTVKGKSPSSIGVDVMVRVPGKEIQVASRKRINRDQNQWVDHEVDFSIWGGQNLELILRCLSNEEGSPGQGENPSCYLSNPRFLQFGPDNTRKNVILIVVDSLREDAISNDPRGPTPNLSRLASRGCKFTRHYAQSSYTLPSMVSMMTSKMPSQTGFKVGLRILNWKLNPSLTTLAEVVQEKKMKTAAVSANGWICAHVGFDQGFDQLIEIAPPFKASFDSGERVNRKVKKCLDQNGDAAFFLFIMYMDPHLRYLPPLSHFHRDQPWRNRITQDLPALYTSVFGNIGRGNEIPLSPQYVEAYRRFYLDEVRYWDHCLGDLIRFLQTRGLLDNSLVIVTADHGEEFLDHGLFYHGTSVYEELIRVPLIIVDGSSPPASGCVVNLNTRHLDLAPTILDYLGIEAPPDFNGVSLLPVGKQPSPESPRTVWSELPYALPPSRFMNIPGAKNYNRCMRTIIRNDFKFISTYDFFSGQLVRNEAFDLAEDPAEKVALEWENSPEFQAMKADLERFFEKYPRKMSSQDQELKAKDIEMIKRLRALGYIQ